MGGLRKLIVLVVCLVMLLCSGCSLLDNGDLAERLRPPRLTGQQETLQQALDTYVVEDYVLTYPRSGDHRAAFLLEDMDGDGVDEAICFYRLKEGNSHVLMLKRDEDNWMPVNDIQGSSADIYWVAWGDMHGDGGHQLLVGWGIYNNDRDRQVILYGKGETGLTALFEAPCAAAFLGDVTATRRDTLLLYRIDDGASKVTVELMALQDGSVTQLSSMRLDGYIRSFGTPQLVPLSDTLSGVFVDGYKDANSITTELVYWDGERLIVPFYDTTTNTNTVTARESRGSQLLTCMDVNGDGRWEWPQNRRLVGYQTAEIREAQFMTSWMYYDPEIGQAQKGLDSLVNTADRYLLTLEPEWVGNTADDDRLTMRYTAATHLLEIQEVSDGVVGETILCIAPTAYRVEPPAEGTTMTVSLSDSASFTVWYRTENGLGLTPERIRYMLIALPS